MAGHSKWANIKFRKGAQDARRGKIFTKLIREITVSAKISGDPASNPRLRSAIDNALSNNMTRDTIDRAIKRATGEGASTQLDEIRYEGYGPYGVAVLVETMTDNKNRTVAEVRHAFSKHGGNLGADGSVGFLFTKAGQLFFSKKEDEVALMETAIDVGADDVLTDEDGDFEVRTSPENFVKVKEALAKKNFIATEASVNYIPSNSVSLNAEQAETFIKMIDMLEDLDDVQNVYSNADISDEVMAAMS